MKIGILGTRGIPNHYGGFEECAQRIGQRLVAMGHQVTVYNSHLHPYEHKEYKGIAIIHKYDAEHRLGSAGQFVYDFNCIMDARKHHFDAILLLGYTSSSVWQRLLPRYTAVVTNMDGMEWKRRKYSPSVRRFLQMAERWAVRYSDLLIADARAIQRYFQNRYNQEVVYIPYGAKKFTKPDPAALEQYSVRPHEYNILVARLEPENNIAMILQGVRKSKSERVMLVVGDHDTEYGDWLKNRFKDSRIRFVKGTYDKRLLNNLRYHSHLYFHGHSAGGTNPSLLEAMACKCLIVAHQNPFNEEVLGEESNFFLDENDVANSLDHLEYNQVQKARIRANLEQLETRYNWDLVAEQYEVVLQQAAIGQGR